MAELPEARGGKGNKGDDEILLGVVLMGLLSGACGRLIESQVFSPDRTLVQVPTDVGLPYEEIWFSSSDAVRLHGWLIPAPGAEYLFLFCHGNAGNISHRLDYIQWLHGLGITVFIFDYRGFGRSSGRISESGFYRDAEAAFSAAREQAQRLQGRVVILGRSLGGIAAVHLGATRLCAGVVLESTFPNLGVIARVHYPVPLIQSWLRNRFNAGAEIGNLRAPLLFVHGDHDRTVPISLGRQLFEAAPEPKQFVTLLGAGHTDTYQVAGEEYAARLTAFLKGL